MSRSSALASKATGYPIAKIAAKIALGYNLDEIKNAVTGKTYACFEPAIDYVVTKIPKWPFDKFFGAKRNLGTKMMATGEIMAIGNTLESSLLKGIRSLEIKQYTLERKSSKKRTTVELKQRVIVPDDERLFDLAELIRRNYNMEKLAEITGMDPFFLQKIKNIVDAEEELKKYKLADLTYDILKKYKKMGFSDKGISELIGIILENLWVLSLFTKWLILVRVNLRLFLRIITQHMTKLQSHSLLIRKKLSLSVRVLSESVKVSNLTIAVFILFFLLKKQVSKQLL